MLLIQQFSGAPKRLHDWLSLSISQLVGPVMHLFEDKYYAPTWPDFLYIFLKRTLFFFEGFMFLFLRPNEAFNVLKAFLI